MREPVKSVIDRWALVSVSISLGVMGISAMRRGGLHCGMVVYSLLQHDSGAEQWSAPRTLPDTRERSLMLGESSITCWEGPRNLRQSPIRCVAPIAIACYCIGIGSSLAGPATQRRPVLGARSPPDVRPCPVTDLPSAPFEVHHLRVLVTRQLSAASTAKRQRRYSMGL